ncbi:hypothetical protein Q3G72_002951 [Acer saccharum]|nr:hypothetical protein Q3G72_002951 [Acer saccharum]
MVKTKIGKRFEGKVAIVTASTQGSGLSIAELLGLEGTSVIVSSRKQKNVDEAVEKLKAKGIENVDEAVEQLKAKETENVCHISNAQPKMYVIYRQDSSGPLMIPCVGNLCWKHYQVFQTESDPNEVRLMRIKCCQKEDRKTKAIVKTESETEVRHASTHCQLAAVLWACHRNCLDTSSPYADVFGDVHNELDISRHVSTIG